jgi:hypothetical protein
VLEEFFHGDDHSYWSVASAPMILRAPVGSTFTFRGDYLPCGGLGDDYLLNGSATPFSR